MKAARLTVRQRHDIGPDVHEAVSGKRLHRVSVQFGKAAVGRGDEPQRVCTALPE